MKHLGIVLGILALGGCHSGIGFLGKRVELRLPALVVHQPRLWEQLKARTRYLEMHIWCEGQLRWTDRFEVSRWEQILLPSSPCPDGQNKFIKIVAQLWDYSLVGEARKVPVLYGSRELSETTDADSETLTIRLNLQVPLEELL